MPPDLNRDNAMVSRPTVLVVEDNYLLLEMLTHLCEQEGIAVLAASSGEAALTQQVESARRRRPGCEGTPRPTGAMPWHRRPGS